MGILEILHKDEFKTFYELSKNVYKPGKFLYHSAISVNSVKETIHSIKFYFGTYQPVNDLATIDTLFKKEDIQYLYKIWDLDNLDNKGLSFCIKFYPEKNSFKYQIHCKTSIPNTFNNLSFSNENCRYGIGIESGERKNYINVTSYRDKTLISSFFNLTDLSFFDELEYCEFGEFSKVVTSFNNQKKYILDNFIKKHTYRYSFMNDLESKGLELRNIGLYKDVDLQSFYYYYPKSSGEVDSYEPFYS